MVPLARPPRLVRSGRVGSFATSSPCSSFFSLLAGVRAGGGAFRMVGLWVFKKSKTALALSVAASASDSGPLTACSTRAFVPRLGIFSTKPSTDSVKDFAASSAESTSSASSESSFLAAARASSFLASSSFKRSSFLRRASLTVSILASAAFISLSASAFTKSFCRPHFDNSVARTLFTSALTPSNDSGVTAFSFKSVLRRPMAAACSSFLF
mmetsp:Transcript_32274/g.69091  ORF Transcript_32274/g.69091 Transcript_32274/m.69091 type:complete len:212 (-) Transcript_32274:984-1619(-)